MPCCDCGFDFAKARVSRGSLTSYVLLAEKEYRAAIRREHAIVVANEQDKKARLIANAAPKVGCLTRCPKCGARLLTQPLKRGRSPYAILRKQPTSRGTE
jgi:hypothetical protein